MEKRVPALPRASTHGDEGEGAAGRCGALVRARACPRAPRPSTPPCRAEAPRPGPTAHARPPRRCRERLRCNPGRDTPAPPRVLFVESKHAEGKENQEAPSENTEDIHDVMVGPHA